MQTLMVKSEFGYRPATRAEIAVVAGAHALESFNRVRPKLDTPTHSVSYIQKIFDGRDYESFAVLFLDKRHHLIECVEMFRGTIDQSQVYVREVVKECLWRGARAVTFAHNHPSGSPLPSEADTRITNRLQQALALIDVRVLDHIIVADGCRYYSMSEHGLL
jgi:DNA repair protein RadC